MMTKLGPKSSEKFHCDLCDFYTCKKSQYLRHLLTRKHQDNDNNDKKYDQTRWASVAPLQLDYSGPCRAQALSLWILGLLWRLYGILELWGLYAILGILGLLGLLWGLFGL